MNKEQLFQNIREAVSCGEVTKGEVIHFTESLSFGDHRDGIVAPIVTHPLTASNRNTLVSKILYTVGGIIALAGILVLLGNNWDAIGAVGRWLVTVGLGLAAFISAFILHKKAEFNVLSQVFFIISAIALCVGGYVWIGDTSFGVIGFAESSLLVGGLLFVVFAAALYASRKIVLHLITTTFFTIAYNALVGKILTESSLGFDTVKDVTIYSSMVIGLGYLAYAYWIKNSLGLNDSNKNSPGLKNYSRLVTFYNLSAFTSILGSALFLDGVWNVLYVLLAICAIALSIKLATTTGLVISVLSIGIYCIKIAVKYFSDSLSFSLALLLTGLLIIGLGYLTYYLNRKYISR